MVKLKVISYCGFEPAWDMYVVDFYRKDGSTIAIVINDDGMLEEYSIEDLKIDYLCFLAE